MGLKDLNDAGVADLLLHATIILTERGHTKGVTLHPETGQIDARGALLLAAGAKPRNIQGFCTTPEEAKIPIYWIPKFHAAIETVEALVGDIDEWNDMPSTTLGDITTAFQKAATRLQIAIT